MPRLPWVCCLLALSALPLVGQSPSQLETNARLRVWSQVYSLRAAEGRLVERWGDTLVVAIERDDSFEPIRELLVLPPSAIDSLDAWAPTARSRRTVRSRLLLVGGIGTAIIAGSAGGLYSFSEAIVSAAFVTLFVAAGSSEIPRGEWVRLRLAPPLPSDSAPTARVPAGPGR